MTALLSYLLLGETLNGVESLGAIIFLIIKNVYSYVLLVNYRMLACIWIDRCYSCNHSNKSC